MSKEEVHPDFDGLLSEGVIAVNLGLREFAESLQAQGIEVLHVDNGFPGDGVFSGSV